LSRVCSATVGSTSCSFGSAHAARSIEPCDLDGRVVADHPLLRAGRAQAGLVRFCATTLRVGGFERRRRITK